MEFVKSFDDCLLWNRLGLSAVGIWPLDQSESSGALRRLHLGFVFFAMCYILVPQWCDLYLLRGNLEASIDTLLSNIFIIGVIFKFYTFVNRMSTFKVFYPSQERFPLLYF